MRNQGEQTHKIKYIKIERERERERGHEYDDDECMSDKEK
jgi:hypothetical protein